MCIKNFFFLVAFAIISAKVSAQSVIVTDDNTYTTGQASSVLDVKSTSKGFLAPRMTNAQRVAITSPAEGLLVYQVDGTKGFYYYSIGSWIMLASGAGSQWTTNVSDIYFNTGNVGIGVAAPSSKLHVAGINPLTLNGVQVGTVSDSLLTIAAGVVRKLAFTTVVSSTTWAMLGNTGSSSGIHFLGTTDLVSLKIRTNNTQRVIVDSLGNTGIGTNPGFTVAPNREKFLIDAGVTTSINVSAARGSINNNLFSGIQNQSAGVSASSDFIAMADNGSTITNFADMGINSSTSTRNIFGGINDAYLYNKGNNLLIGTGTAARSLIFMTGGTIQSVNERMRIDGNGNVGIGVIAPSSKLHISGTNPLTLNGVQTGAVSDSIITIASGIIRKLPFATVSPWTIAGNNIYYSTGDVGIGISNPTLPLVVKDTMEIRRVGSLSELLFTNTVGSGDCRIASDGGNMFLQSGGGRNLQIGGFGGIVLGGDRQVTAFPAYTSAGTNTNVLALAQRDASVPLAVQANSATQSANLMEWRSFAATLNVVDKSGKMGIGVTSPTAMLHLKAGTSTAGSAPLKLNSGTNLATAEDGAVEYDGTNYYASSGTVRYTLAKTITTTASLDFPSTSAWNSSDINVTLTGAVLGDVVLVGVPVSSVQPNSNYSAFVVSANVVTVRFNNIQFGTSNPTTGVFRIAIIKY